MPFVTWCLFLRRAIRVETSADFDSGASLALAARDQVQGHQGGRQRDEMQRPLLQLLLLIITTFAYVSIVAPFSDSGNVFIDWYDNS